MAAGQGARAGPWAGCFYAVARLGYSGVLAIGWGLLALGAGLGAAIAGGVAAAGARRLGDAAPAIAALVTGLAIAGLGVSIAARGADLLPAATLGLEAALLFLLTGAVSLAALELVGFGEGAADFVGDGPFLALFGVLGAVQDVGLGGFELAGGLQGQLDGVLDDLDRRLARPRRHDVDHAQGELGDRRVRLPPESGEAAAQGALDAHRIEEDDPPIAFDDGGRQGDVVHLHTIEDAHPRSAKPRSS